MNKNSESQTKYDYKPYRNTAIELDEDEITTQTSGLISREEENGFEEAVVVSKEASTSSVETKIVRAASLEVNENKAVNRNEYQKVCY